MTIDEYARTYCRHLLRDVNADSLLEKIKERDDLPYDDIRYDENGDFTKVVFIDDSDRAISIYELISYSDEDMMATKDEDLIQVYNNYMALLNSKDVTILDTVKLAREWREARAREEESLGVLS